MLSSAFNELKAKAYFIFRYSDAFADVFLVMFILNVDRKPNVVEFLILMALSRSQLLSSSLESGVHLFVLRTSQIFLAVSRPDVAVARNATGCVQSPPHRTHTRALFLAAHATCDHTFGGQNSSRDRQTVFFTAANPMQKNHQDPMELDLTKPRLAQYMHKA